MAGVYSTRFGVVTTNGWNDIPVPAGKRAVVKMITALNNSAAAANFGVGLARQSWWLQLLQGSTAINAVGLHLVFNAGDVISVYQGAQSGVVTLHGFLLDM